jgi:hypothetical protein
MREQVVVRDSESENDRRRGSQVVKGRKNEEYIMNQLKRPHSLINISAITE